MTSAASLFTETTGILLDFDGPVCRLFSGYPASDIAEELRIFVSERASASNRFPESDDPLEILRWTGMTTPTLLPDVEDMQVRAERCAVESAAATQGADTLISAAAPRAMAIVSNNSASAINHYLDRQGLASNVTSVVGRTPTKPWLMKPCPDPVLRAAQQIGVPARACILIGDSPTDIEAARAAGAWSIGYAKRPNQIGPLAAAGADLVVESMTQLADALVQAEAPFGEDQ